jgi:carbonic anhydrase/acetyltransferase-like protein (isoleucine patch superfamily)
MGIFPPKNKVEGRLHTGHRLAADPRFDAGDNDFRINLSTSDIVSPGEKVELTVEFLRPPAEQTKANFFTTTNFTFGLGMTDLDTGKYSELINEDDLPFNPQAIGLVGSVKDSLSVGIYDESLPSTDTKGYNGIPPVVPKNTKVDGFVARANRWFGAWDIGKQKLFSFLGIPNPICFVVPICFDVQVELTFNIAEQYFFSSDLITAYYSFEPLFPTLQAFAINDSGQAPTVTIPPNAPHGEIIELTINELVMDVNLTFDYYLTGLYKYTVCMPSWFCGPLNTGRNFNNELMKTFAKSGKHVIPAGQKLQFLSIFPQTPIRGELEKIQANDGEVQDRFGTSVAIDGEFAVVGAPYGDNSSVNGGAAYIFERHDGVWQMQAKLTASDSAADDRFGYSVAIDGETVLIGAYHGDGAVFNSGAAYVFARANNGSWTEQAKIYSSDGAIYDDFGRAVSLSGNTAVIGAPQDDDRGDRSGSAYVFVRVGDVWIPQQKLLAHDGEAADEFGAAIELDGNSLIVGSPGDDDLGNVSGSAYIFDRFGTEWMQQTKLVADDGGPSDLFGISVSLDDTTAIVGAFGDSDDVFYGGSAYIFVGSGSEWTQQAKLTASEPAYQEGFGYSVSVQDNTASVGTIRGDRAIVFTRFHEDWLNQGNALWVEKAELVSSDVAAFDALGKSVAYDNGTVLVAAEGDNGGTGSTYVFGGIVDTDGDGIFDDFDNCLFISNPNQVDINGDGYGDSCVDPSAIIPYSAVVDPSAVIGANTVVNSGVVVDEDVFIGSNSTINQGVTIHDGAVIGDYAIVDRGSEIRSGAEIGNMVNIERYVVIDEDAPVQDNATINKESYIGAEAVIGTGATIGASSVICPQAEVGSGVVLGKYAFVDSGAIQTLSTDANKYPRDPAECSAPQ